MASLPTTFDTRSLGFTTQTKGPKPIPLPSNIDVPDNSGVTAPAIQPPQISPSTVSDIFGLGIKYVGERLFGPEVVQGFGVADCPPGELRLPGGVCFNPTAVLPGGVPALTPAATAGGLQDVSLGIFGLLSAQPMVIGEIRGRPVLRCPHPGLVLGKDDRCYSKKDLPSKLRKWPPHKCVSATDRKIKAIKAAGAAAKSLTATFKGSGFKISRNK